MRTRNGLEIQPIYEDEDGDTFLISSYSHGDNDSYRMIELDGAGKEVFDRKDHMTLHYLSYEVEVVYRHDLRTHKAVPIAVNTDGVWFGEELEDHQLRAARHNGSR